MMPESIWLCPRAAPDGGHDGSTPERAAAWIWEIEGALLQERALPGPVVGGMQPCRFWSIMMPWTQSLNSCASPSMLLGCTH